MESHKPELKFPIRKSDFKIKTNDEVWIIKARLIRDTELNFLCKKEFVNK